MMFILNLTFSASYDTFKKYVTFLELTNKIKYPIHSNSEKRVSIPLVIKGAIYETYY